MGANEPFENSNIEEDTKILFESNDTETLLTDIILPTPHWSPKLKTKKEQLFQILKTWSAKGVRVPFYINPKINVFVIRFDQTIERFASKEIYKEILELKYPHEIVIKTGDLRETDF